MIPIARPLFDDEEKKAVLAVLDSGQLAQGPVVKQFEDAFAHTCGVEHAIAVSNGTTALWVALLAHNVGQDDEVITTPFTFVASANAALYVGARPVFVDVEDDCCNIDVRLIERKITKRTKAIMPVHLYGHPADMGRIMELAEAYKLAVIEDACQAHGAAVNGRSVGSFGTGCFSFYPTKNITTAEGGMITTNDSRVAESARLLREHGSRKRYFHELLGYNFRMTELHAAVGVAQLRKLSTFNERRIANARYLSERLTRVAKPKVKDGYTHVFHQYTVRVPGRRDELARWLKERGIGTAIHYPMPVHRQPLYQQLGYTDSLPVSERLSEEVLSLPVHPGLSREDLDAIIAAVEEFPW